MHWTLLSHRIVSGAALAPAACLPGVAGEHATGAQQLRQVLFGELLGVCCQGLSICSRAQQGLSLASFACQKAVACPSCCLWRLCTVLPA